MIVVRYNKDHPANLHYQALARQRVACARWGLAVQRGKTKVTPKAWIGTLFNSYKLAAQAAEYLRQKPRGTPAGFERRRRAAKAK